MYMKYTNLNSVLFALTRMNPPMPGHLALIEKLIRRAILMGIDHVYVCLSKTVDKSNPIECELKKTVLGDETQPFEAITMINSLKKKMIENTNDPEVKKKIKNMGVILLCTSEKESSPFHTILNVIRNVIEELNQQTILDDPTGLKRKHSESSLTPRTENLEKINLFIVAGEDRTDFIESVEKYYSNWEQVNKPISKEVLLRGAMSIYIEQTKTQEGIRNLKIEEISKAHGWSGTMIRNIVIHGGETKENKDIFQKIYDGMLEPDVADKLYDAIWDGLHRDPKIKTPKLNTSKSAPALPVSVPGEILVSKSANNRSRKKVAMNENGEEPARKKRPTKNERDAERIPIETVTGEIQPIVLGKKSVKRPRRNTPKGSSVDERSPFRKIHRTLKPEDLIERSSGSQSIKSKSKSKSGGKSGCLKTRRRRRR